MPYFRKDATGKYVPVPAGTAANGPFYTAEGKMILPEGSSVDEKGGVSVPRGWQRMLPGGERSFTQDLRNAEPDLLKAVAIGALGPIGALAELPDVKGTAFGLVPKPSDIKDTRFDMPAVSGFMVSPEVQRLADSKYAAALNTGTGTAAAGIAGMTGAQPDAVKVPYTRTDAALVRNTGTYADRTEIDPAITGAGMDAAMGRTRGLGEKMAADQWGGAVNAARSVALATGGMSQGARERTVGYAAGAAKQQAAGNAASVRAGEMNAALGLGQRASAAQQSLDAQREAAGADNYATVARANSGLANQQDLDRARNEYTASAANSAADQTFRGYQRDYLTQSLASDTADFGAKQAQLGFNDAMNEAFNMSDYNAAANSAERQYIKGLNGVMGAMSDRSAKRRIRDGSSAVREMLGALAPVLYEYRDQERDGEGEKLGIIAQDLEKSDMGKSLVVEAPRGKMVQFGKAIPMLMAAAADQEHRLAKLERGKNGR